MFKVKKGKENNTIYTHFVVRLGDATQEQLEHLKSRFPDEIEEEKEAKISKSKNK